MLCVCVQTAARVFDALLFEGSKVLHRVAVAMFKLTEPRLLQASDTMAAALSLRSATLRMHDRDLIMRTAVRRVGPLPQATIDKLRASQKPNGLFSVFLSRITLNRKPVKAVPWHSQVWPHRLAVQMSYATTAPTYKLMGCRGPVSMRHDVQCPCRDVWGKLAKMM